MSEKWCGWRKWVIKIITSLLFLSGFVIVAILTVPAWAEWANQNSKLPAKAGLITAAIVPPFFLWAEFCFIWRTAPENERPNLEDFKYGQEVGRNIWLAFVGLIAALYFK